MRRIALLTGFLALLATVIARDIAPVGGATVGTTLGVTRIVSMAARSSSSPSPR